MTTDLISFNTFIYRAQHSEHPVLIDREALHAFVRGQCAFDGDTSERVWWWFWDLYREREDAIDLLNTQADALV